MEVRRQWRCPRRPALMVLAASVLFALVVPALLAADAGAATRSLLRGVRATPASFYGGEGVAVSKRAAKVTYTTTARSRVSVVVRDASGATVRTLRVSKWQGSGKHAIWWDGRLKNGSPASVGKYSALVTARARSRVFKGVARIAVLASPLSGVVASPSAISRDTGTTTLSYVLGAKATVAIVVQDVSGKTVRTLKYAGLQTAGPYSVTWDGKRADGATFPLGDYRFQITASTAAGTVRQSAAVRLVEQAVIGGAEVSPASFHGGAGASGKTTLSYSLTGPAEVAVTAEDAAGATVATIQPSTAQAAGSYAVDWNGTSDSGATLRPGVYRLVVQATNTAGDESASLAVAYAPTPVANEAALAVDGDGGYVLHTVVERWDETLNGQTAADHYYDGAVQPWEYTAVSASTVTLYVGTNPADPQDTAGGGAVTGTTDTTGVTDLAFPALTWSSPVYYSVKVSYGGSTRWYPAAGRYRVRPPADADGHIRFAFMSDIQTPLEKEPTPDLEPKAMTAAYSAIPNLSLSRGWAKVLSGVKAETGTNLVVFGGDAVQRAGDATAPDDGATQWRQLLDNEQTFGSGDEWSLSSLASSVPVQMAVGNHDDVGVGDATTALANRALNNRWLYRPQSADSDRGYYAFDQGDVHFVVINPYLMTTVQYTGWIGLQSLTAGGTRSGLFNSSVTYSNSRQADWLIGALDSDKPWTVVVAHTPLFDAQNSAPWSQVNQTGAPTSANDAYYGERDRLLQLFAAKGVDLVLQGHLHMFRHHVEKVQTASGDGQSAITFLNDGLAGAAPIGATESGYGAWIDWIDQPPINGRYDAGEPLATPADDHYDLDNLFGTPDNVHTSKSGYLTSSDMFHQAGEYGDGLTFSYSVFQTGTDGLGAPTLTMQVKTVKWNAVTHQWGSWVEYESGAVSQVTPGMVPRRLLP